MVNGQRKSVPKLNQERSDRAFQAKNTDSLEPRSISQHPISSIYAWFQSDSTILINLYSTGPPHFRTNGFQGYYSMKHFSYDREAWLPCWPVNFSVWNQRGGEGGGTWKTSYSYDLFVCWTMAFYPIFTSIATCQLYILAKLNVHFVLSFDMVASPDKQFPSQFYLQLLKSSYHFGCLFILIFFGDAVYFFLSGCIFIYIFFGMLRMYSLASHIEYIHVGKSVLYNVENLFCISWTISFL